MDVNSSHMLCLSSFALVDVIWSAEKSNTSSDSSRKIAMLFSQIGKLLWHDETISLMKVGQLCGHSCLRMDTRTRLSLLSSTRWLLKLSSVLEHWMMKLTTKLRMPILSAIAFFSAEG